MLNRECVCGAHVVHDGRESFKKKSKQLLALVSQCLTSGLDTTDPQ